MNRANSKKRIATGIVIDISDMTDVALSGGPESYESLVKARSDLQRPMLTEMPTAPERPARAEMEPALPAWIKAQVEQMELQLEARRLSGVQRISTMQKSD